MHNAIYRLMNKFIYLLISIYSLLTLTTAAAQTLSPYPPKVETAIAQSPIDRKEWTRTFKFEVQQIIRFFIGSNP